MSNGEVPTSNQILALSCSLDCERCVTAGVDCHIRVYNIESRSLLRICSSSFGKTKIDGHVRRICAVKYHPRGKYYLEYAHIFISGGWDDTIQIWDDRYAHSLWVLPGPHVCSCDALDIEEETNYILSSSWRIDKYYLQVWEFNEDEIVKFYQKAESTPDGSLYMTAGGADGTVMARILGAKPRMELAPDTENVPTKGYVAKWMGTHYFMYGGSDCNLLRVVSRVHMMTVATVTNLLNGVYSAAYIPSATDDPKRLMSLAFASGSKLYLTKVDQK